MGLARGRTAVGAVMAALILPGNAIGSDSGRGTSAAPDEMSRFMGDWQGSSLCVAKNTACRDEDVIYHVSKLPGKPGAVSITADKIVQGNAVNMGTLEFQYDHDQHTLICKYSQGVWRLKVHDGKLEGTLTQPDSNVFRRINLRKKQ